MRFELRTENWTAEAASLWGDLLELGRPATFEEAKADLREHGFDGSFADYFRPDGSYKGPCTLAISVECRN